MNAPVQAQTRSGARAMDRVAAAQLAAAAAIDQANATEAEALAQLRIREARDEAAERAREREQERRAQAEAERGQARAAKVARRLERRQRLREAWAERRGLVAVVPMMGASAAVAWPAQAEFYAAVTGSQASAVAIAAMVEGGTWMGAALESAAIEARQPAGRFRVLTWGLAGVAAGVNVAHGLSTSGGWQVAVVFGMASVLGPTAWAAYARLRSGQVAGRTVEDFQRAAWRRIWHPRLSWRAADLRATTATGLDPEQAWQRVWSAHVSRPARWWRRTHRSDRVCGTDPIGSVPRVDRVQGTDQTPLDPIGSEVGSDPLVIGPGPIAVSIGSDPVPVVEAIEPTPVVSDAGRADRGSDRGAPVRRSAPGSSRRGVRSGGRSGVRSLEELRAELADRIDAGDLPDRPTADAIREALGIGPARARVLRDERAALPCRSTEPQVVDRIGADPAPVAVDLIRTESIGGEPIGSSSAGPIEPIGVGLPTAIGPGSPRLQAIGALA